MNIKSIILIAIVAIGERFMKKRYPKLHRKLQLPTTIALSILVAIYSVIYIYAIYDVMISSVPIMDKVFFSIFMVVAISILLGLTAIEWKRWIQMKKGKE